MFEENRFKYLQHQPHCRQLPVNRCLSGCIFCSPTRQRRLGHDLFVDSGGRVGLEAVQEQHMKIEEGNMLIQEIQTTANKSFHFTPTARIVKNDRKER